MVNLFPGVPARCLCDKHLNSVLAEYNNLFMPSIRKGNSIKGYIQHGCVDIPQIYNRIVECLKEVDKRGLKWKYKYPSVEDIKLFNNLTKQYNTEFPDIDDSSRREEMAIMNLRILAFRCKDCRDKILEECL